MKKENTPEIQVEDSPEIQVEDSPEIQVENPSENPEDNQPADCDAAGADSSADSFTPDMEAMLAEAEQRGYMRGRNERIEELMNEPAPFARQSSPQRAAEPADPPSTSEPLILNNPRVSIWDR